MKPKIGIITLGVRDFAKSLAFYREGLGLSTHNYKEGEDHVMFKMEGSWLSLYPRDKLAEDATVPDDGKGFSGITLAHNEPSPEAVDTAFAEALRAGAKAIKPPRKVFWGGYSGYFADPDGYLWEVAYNPFTDLT
jgi:catechol 2,3-dioxygenase-like lactoylglutathione lyase family enzyme